MKWRDKNMNNENMKTNVIDTKEIKSIDEQIVMNYLDRVTNPFALLTAPDISKDLHIGINQAYDLMKQEDFPTITIGKRKVVTLAAYLIWKMNKKGRGRHA